MYYNLYNILKMVGKYLFWCMPVHSAIKSTFLNCPMIKGFLLEGS